FLHPQRPRRRGEAEVIHHLHEVIKVVEVSHRPIDRTQRGDFALCPVRRSSVIKSSTRSALPPAADPTNGDKTMKKVLGRYGNDRGHWVGDGFPVRSLFSYNAVGKQVSPFLLLDYAGPYNFEPTTEPRGVGQHPHRGFETVTIVYDREVEHRVSAGQGGIIVRGDVQWLTAVCGILHEEFHSPASSRTGGPF